MIIILLNNFREITKINSVHNGENCREYKEMGNEIKDGLGSELKWESYCHE